MLCIKSVQNADRVYPLHGFKFSLGCAQECDIVIENDTLNEVHALLWLGKDFVTVMTVQDAEITVNGALVTDQVIVKVNGKISFAEHEMQVIEQTSESTKPKAQTAIDRQKISIMQRKPERLNSNIQTIQAQQSLYGRLGTIFRTPMFWLFLITITAITVTVSTTSS